MGSRADRWGISPHFLVLGLSHRESPRDLSQFRRDEPDKEETLQFAPEVLPPASTAGVHHRLNGPSERYRRRYEGTLKPAGADNGTLGNRKVLLKKYILETRELNLGTARGLAVFLILRPRGSCR